MKQLLSVYSAYKSVVQIFVSHLDNFPLVNIFMKPIFFVNFFCLLKVLTNSFKVFISQ